jgi:hypothetical protein
MGLEDQEGRLFILGAYRSSFALRNDPITTCQCCIEKPVMTGIDTMFYLCLSKSGFKSDRLLDSFPLA